MVCCITRNSVLLKQINFTNSYSLVGSICCEFRIAGWTWYVTHSIIHTSVDNKQICYHYTQTRYPYTKGALKLAIYKMKQLFTYWKGYIGKLFKIWIPYSMNFLISKCLTAPNFFFDTYFWYEARVWLWSRETPINPRILAIDFL